MKIIYLDDYLRYHFYMLCYYCQNLIGYSITAAQKGEFVRIIKEKFPDCPQVLAIGDSYNDSIMMHKADFSIQMFNKNRKIMNFGSILVRNFDTIIQLIFSYSYFFTEIYNDIIYFTFYRAFLLGYFIFFFNIVQCTYGSQIFTSYQIFFYETFFYICSLLLYFYCKYSKFTKF